MLKQERDLTEYKCVIDQDSEPKDGNYSILWTLLVCFQLPGLLLMKFKHFPNIKLLLTIYPYRKSHYWVFFCISRCLVNSFTYVISIMVAWRENAFQATGGMLSCNTTSGHWAKLEAKLSGSIVSWSTIHRLANYCNLDDSNLEHASLLTTS